MAQKLLRLQQTRRLPFSTIIVCAALVLAVNSFTPKRLSQSAASTVTVIFIPGAAVLVIEKVP